VNATKHGDQWRRSQVGKPSRFYRCPACGEQVDKESPEQIRIHHYHALHRDGLEQRSVLSPPARQHAAQTWVHGQRRRACS